MLIEAQIATLIAALAGGFLVYRLVNHLIEVQNKKPKLSNDPAIKKFDTEERRIIRYVREERKKAGSPFRNAFRGYMVLITPILVIFIGLFWVFDWIYAGLKSLGDPFYQKLYFTGFASLDALMPIMMIFMILMGWSWNKYRPLFVASLVLMFFGTFMNYFISQGASGQVGSQLSTMGTAAEMKTNGSFEDIQNDRNRLSELKKLTRRHPDEIRSEIVPDNVIASTSRARQAIWNRTREKRNERRVGLGCKDVTKFESQKACRKITELRTELARAIEREGLEKSVPKMEANLNKNRNQLRRDYDPQATSIGWLMKRWFGVEAEKASVSTGLTQMFSLVLATVFTLIAVAYPWPLNWQTETSQRDRREDTDVMLADIGFIEDNEGHIRPVREADAERYPDAVKQAIMSDVSEMKSMIKEHISRPASQTRNVDNSLTINGMEGLDSNPDILRVEQFLIKTIVGPVSVQEAYKSWKEFGNPEPLKWFAENARLASLKTNNLTLANETITHAA